MAERIATMMSIIIVTFIIVTVAAIIRGIYIVKQKQRESKMREALYFNRMKAEREKKKAEQAKEQDKLKDICDVQDVNGSEKTNESIVGQPIHIQNVDKTEESKEQVKKEVEFDWLTGEAIFEDK